jgi:hypothetical protein
MSPGCPVQAEAAGSNGERRVRQIYNASGPTQRASDHCVDLPSLFPFSSTYLRLFFILSGCGVPIFLSRLHMLAACPAPASTKTAEATLNDAQVTGNTLVELDKAAASLSQSLKNATALTPSLNNCQSSIRLAESSTFAGCGILFVPPALNGQVIQACTAAAAAQLSIAEAGCGSLANVQKTHADAVLAGVVSSSQTRKYSLCLPSLGSESNLA